MPLVLEMVNQVRMTVPMPRFSWNAACKRLMRCALGPCNFAQVLALHPRSKYIHIGCDEVFNIASCSACRAKSSVMGTEGVFLDHVCDVLLHCRRAGVQPLIWHDMVETYVGVSLEAGGVGPALLFLS